MLKKLFLSMLVLSSLIFAEGNTTKPADITISATTIDGKTFAFKGKKTGLIMPDNLKGKVVLMEFWGTHCPPCLMSIPHYIDLTKKYKGKVEMLAVEVQMTPKAQLAQFVKQKGINYNVFTQADNQNFVRYLGTRAGWRGAIPYLLIFDTNGNVLAIKRGFVSEQYVESVVKYALNPPKSTQVSDKNSTDKNATK